MPDDAKAALQQAVCDVIFEAWSLCDNTANSNPPEVPQESWDRLSSALSRLEELIPEGERPCMPSVAARLLAMPQTNLSQAIISDITERYAAYVLADKDTSHAG